MKTPHVHAAMIKEWVEDTSLVVEYRAGGGRTWVTTRRPDWVSDLEYRIRHKHQDLIDAKAARPELVVEVEVLSGYSPMKPIDPFWLKATDGVWLENGEYRLVEPRHKHQDLINRKKERPELIVETISDDAWVPTGEAVMWFKDSEYRLVEPTKKKVKMWQWVVKHDTKIYLSDFFYGTEELARAMSLGKVIQRADWTEIEILVDE